MTTRTKYDPGDYGGYPQCGAHTREGHQCSRPGVNWDHLVGRRCTQHMRMEQPRNPFWM